MNKKRDFARQPVTGQDWRLPDEEPEGLWLVVLYLLGIVVLGLMTWWMGWWVLGILGAAVAVCWYRNEYTVSQDFGYKAGALSVGNILTTAVIISILVGVYWLFTQPECGVDVYCAG